MARLAWRMRLWAVLAVPVAMAIAVAACGGGGSSSSASEESNSGGQPTATPTPEPVVTVQVSDNKFEPAELTIKEGTVVRWEWVGTQNQHSVLLGGSESAKQSSGSYERDFSRGVGSYSYQCGVHGASMAGKIIVQ